MMGGQISEIIEPNVRWDIKSQKGRQAIASLGGYAYQLNVSVAQWLRLSDGAKLHLEKAEDYAVTVDGKLIATQVGDTDGSGNVTLQNEKVLDTIQSFWNLQSDNSKPVEFVYLTTSGIGKEKKPLSNGEKGLVEWSNVAAGGGPAALREALVDRLTDGPLKTFSKSSTDVESRARLVSPIKWVCGSELLDVAQI